MNLTHTCDGTDHIADIAPTATARLGCGCTRWRGVRCDGTRIEWLSGDCERHREEA